jgi:hypothetical protein
MRRMSREESWTISIFPARICRAIIHSDTIVTWFENLPARAFFMRSCDSSRFSRISPPWSIEEGTACFIARCQKTQPRRGILVTPQFTWCSCGKFCGMHGTSGGALADTHLESGTRAG